jgi:hypothetical protein
MRGFHCGNSIDVYNVQGNREMGKERKIIVNYRAFIPLELDRSYQI